MMLRRSLQFGWSCLNSRAFFSSGGAGQELEIPQISIGSFGQQGLDSKAAQQTIGEIGQAAKEWGFFQITDHPIGESLTQQVYTEMEALFSLPRSETDKFSRTERNSKGYFHTEYTKQRKDWKEGFDFGAQNGSLDESGMDGSNQWPSAAVLPHFQPVMRRYFEACYQLSLQLLEAVVRSLGLPGRQLHPHFVQHSSFLRLNYYPACPDPSDNLGIHPHTDAGAITLLSQSQVCSLQVLRDGAWYDLNPLPGGLVINIGDIIQVVSNDRYRAPVHRVKAQASQRRFSTPFFLNPDYRFDYQPLVDLHSPKYRPINWGHFRLARFGGDYADLGQEEVQISHYRI